MTYPGTLAAAYRAARAQLPLMWYEVPPPRRWHRCKPFTSGHRLNLLGMARQADRCSCGAIRFAGGPWMERNSRRKASR